MDGRIDDVEEIKARLLGGWTEHELRDAFARVENKSHWKGPINAVVLPLADGQGELDMIAFAVWFYTATEATITALGNGAYQAPGYWAGPAN